MSRRQLSRHVCWAHRAVLQHKLERASPSPAPYTLHPSDPCHQATMHGRRNVPGLGVCNGAGCPEKRRSSVSWAPPRRSRALAQAYLLGRPLHECTNTQTIYTAAATRTHMPRLAPFSLPRRPRSHCPLACVPRWYVPACYRSLADHTSRPAAQAAADGTIPDELSQLLHLGQAQNLAATPPHAPLVQGRTVLPTRKPLPSAPAPPPALPLAAAAWRCSLLHTAEVVQQPKLTAPCVQLSVKAEPRQPSLAKVSYDGCQSKAGNAGQGARIRRGMPCSLCCVSRRPSPPRTC